MQVLIPLYVYDVSIKTAFEVLLSYSSWTHLERNYLLCKIMTEKMKKLIKTRFEKTEHLSQSPIQHRNLTQSLTLAKFSFASRTKTGENNKNVLRVLLTWQTHSRSPNTRIYRSIPRNVFVNPYHADQMLRPWVIGTINMFKISKSRTKHTNSGRKVSPSREIVSFNEHKTRDMYSLNIYLYWTNR